MTVWISAALRAVVQLVLVVVALYLVIFLAFRVVTLEPVRAVLGPMASAEAVATYRRQLTLDAPLGTQLHGMLVGALHADFGNSIYYRTAAGPLVWAQAPYSLSRAGLSVVVGAALALLAAGTVSRRAAQALAPLLLLVASVPALCWLLLGLWLFSRALQWTPLQHPLQFEALAVCVALLVPFGVVGTNAIQRLQPVEDEPPYLPFMRSLGASDRNIAREVLRHHAALFVAVAVATFPAALTASTFAELMFDLPGMGSQFVRACERGDIPMIHAGATLLAICYVALQAVARPLTERLDVRQR
jgi:peptide/nickel transport system permease protein